MRKVRRDELVDYATWTDARPVEVPRILEIKAARRVHVGEHLTFLFENADTVRYQIQEMMRVERIVREADIQHELDTYNELLGEGGELGCVLLIEIDDEQARNRLLREWLDLPQHLYVELADGTKARAIYDPRQVGEERVSSVQYLKFDTGGQVPVAVGSDLPALTVRAALDETQRAALASDLKG